MLAGRLLREGVLQQSALSANDASCSAGQGGRARRRGARRRRPLRGAGRVRGAAATASRRSTSAPLLRAREETGPDDADGRTRARGDAMLAGAGGGCHEPACRRGRVHRACASCAGRCSWSAACAGVGWDEFATHPARRPGETRHGLVLEVDRRPRRGPGAGGHRRHRPGGTAGRVRRRRRCASRSAPAGSAGSATAAASRSTAARRCWRTPGRRSPGCPLNPTHREPPRRAGAHRRLGHRRADHPGARPEAAGVLRRRAAAPRAGHPDRGAGDRRRRAVLRGLRRHGADPRGRRAVRDALEERSAAGELVLLLNTADDPVVERILTPRLALTIAEHLAFDAGPARAGGAGRHDAATAEALREVSAARGEIPARRAYPGYLYSDLASLYERCGRIRGAARVGHRACRC